MDFSSVSNSDELQESLIDEAFGCESDVSKCVPYPIFDLY